jgi:CoA:oxalate CoA-transferase
MLDATFSMLLTVLAAQLYGAGSPSRCGNRHPITYPVDLFSARDGDLVMVAISDAVFARLMAAIGRPELAGDERFRTNAARNGHEAELRAIIQDWIGRHTRAEVERALDEAEVPCGPVWSIAEVAASAHIAASGMIASPPHPRAGAAPLVPQPVLFDGRRLPTGRAPLLGEHTEQVLGEIAGLGETEIAALRRERAI